MCSRICRMNGRRSPSTGFTLHSLSIVGRDSTRHGVATGGQRSTSGGRGFQRTEHRQDWRPDRRDRGPSASDQAVRVRYSKARQSPMAGDLPEAGRHSPVGPAAAQLLSHGRRPVPGGNGERAAREQQPEVAHLAVACHASRSRGPVERVGGECAAVSCTCGRINAADEARSSHSCNHQRAEVNRVTAA